MYIKLNTSTWEVDNFKSMYKIKSVKDMWQVLNNVPDSLAGVTNIFFMENDIVPLWEANVQLWSNGGCWSTIVKGPHWIKTMKEICITVMGESVFDDRVKGICIVPVGANHCIVKLWSTINSDEISTMFKSSLESITCCQPRFKAFTK